ncbi:sodium channel protein nach [Lasius niger]|uniref:Sodium channel protein nach n=1 Tax=Lasius niger TaxID=67767 RepID=A0A0J7KY05_LASNI|nr:sodium channel protein nach [Lasius niger]
MSDVFKAKQSRVHTVDKLGIGHGLTVVMEPFLDDYFYPILPVKGWKASKSGIKYHLERLCRENQTATLNIPHSPE